MANLLFPFFAKPENPNNRYYLTSTKENNMARYSLYIPLFCSFLLSSTTGCSVSLVHTQSPHSSGLISFPTSKCTPAVIDTSLSSPSSQNVPAEIDEIAVETVGTPCSRTSFIQWPFSLLSQRPIFPYREVPLIEIHRSKPFQNNTLGNGDYPPPPHPRFHPLPTRPVFQ